MRGVDQVNALSFLREKRASRQRGQSVVEYVMLLVLIAGLGTVLSFALPKVFAKLEEPLTKGFRFAYQYGDPEACSFENQDCGGAPKRHIRHDQPENFRLFGRAR